MSDINRVNDHQLSVTSQNSVILAMWELAHLHFDVFCAHETTSKKGERAKLMRGATKLTHAFNYLETIRNAANL